jgi:hypothetical protein
MKLRELSNGAIHELAKVHFGSHYQNDDIHIHWDEKDPECTLAISSDYADEFLCITEEGGLWCVQKNTWEREAYFNKTKTLHWLIDNKVEPFYKSEAPEFELKQPVVYKLKLAPSKEDAINVELARKLAIEQWGVSEDLQFEKETNDNETLFIIVSDGESHDREALVISTNGGIWIEGDDKIKAASRKVYYLLRDNLVEPFCSEVNIASLDPYILTSKNKETFEVTLDKNMFPPKPNVITIEWQFGVGTKGNPFPYSKLPLGHWRHDITDELCQGETVGQLHYEDEEGEEWHGAWQLKSTFEQIEW